MHILKGKIDHCWLADKGNMGTHDVPTFASTFAQHLLMQMLGPFERADSNTFTFQEQSELKYEFGSKEGKTNVGLGYKGNTTQRKIKKCCYLSDFSVWGI